MVRNWQSWCKVLLNALLTGIIAGISSVVATGGVDYTLSAIGIGALLAGLLSFCIELKSYLREEIESNSHNSKTTQALIVPKRNYLMFF